MRALLLAASLAACTPAPPSPVASPPQQQPAPPAPTLRGALLVSGPFGIAACKPSCALLAEPGLAHPQRAPRRIAPGRYLFSEGIHHFEDATLEPLPSAIGPSVKSVPHPLEEGALWFLADGALVHVEHHATSDRVRISRGGAPFAPWSESVPPKSYEYRFLADGRHLFKTAPLLGKQESPYFEDVIEGQSVSLQYVPAIGAQPKKLVARPQALHPDFVGDGSTIVYWTPGQIDEANNTRRLLLEGVDVATGKTIGLGSVTTPVTIESFGNKSYWRGTPRTLHHVHSRYVVHGASIDAKATAKSVRIVDVPAASSFEVPLAEGEELVSPFDVTHTYYGGTAGRRDDDVLILARPDPQGTLVRVLSLPALDVVLQVIVPAIAVQTVDFVRN